MSTSNAFLELLVVQLNKKTNTPSNIDLERTIFEDTYKSSSKAKKQNGRL